MRRPSAIAFAFFTFFTGIAVADDINIAVASNFTGAIARLAPEFERATGHKLIPSYASTGILYAQIKNGAPFDLLLAADDEHPRLLETEDVGVPGTRFTYAVGRLVLWSPKPGAVDDKGDVLRIGQFAHLAIANPKTAPYGVAAEQVLRRSGLWERLSSRLVFGENIAQTLQFVSTGNAELGFVALAQVHALSKANRGSFWRVPENLHDPISQDAVLLKQGERKRGARAFLEFLRSSAARAIIEDQGYFVPSG